VFRRLMAAVAICLLLGLRVQTASPFRTGDESPDETYWNFIRFLERGDMANAKRLTNGKVRIVSEDKIVETTPYVNAKAFQRRLNDDILLRRKLHRNQVLLRSGYAYFFLERRRGKWIIVKAGLKPID
jgi:hypothetical protein